MGVKFDGTANTGLTSRLGAQTIYLVDALAADGVDGTAQISGPAPAVSTMSTGWTLPTLAGANDFSPMLYATNQGAGTFGTTTLPSAAPTLNGDCFVSSTRLTGNFLAGAWTISVAVIVSGGSAPTGSANLNVRIWHSPDGATFTEITAGATSMGTINLATTSQQNTTLTTASLATANLNSERLYFQFALEEQTPAVATGAVVQLVQDGTNSKVTTPSFAATTGQSSHTSCMFFYGPTLPASGLSECMWSMCDGQSGVFTNFNFLGILGDATSGHVVYFNATGTTAGATGSIKAAQWYFIALVVSGTNLWLYSKPVGAPCMTVTTNTNATVFTPAELNYGQDGIGASGQDPATGVAAGGRVWLAALSQTELERESRSLVPVRTADLWESWPLLSDTDVVGHVRGTTLVANVLASSNAPFSGPPLAYPAKRVRR